MSTKVYISRRANCVCIYTHCPFHDDRNPSLRVVIYDDGRVYAKCYAGCEITEERKGRIMEILSSERSLSGITLPKRETELVTDKRQLFEDFCKARGISLDIANSMGLRVVSGEDVPELKDAGTYAILIPLRGVSGQETYQLRVLNGSVGQRFLMKRNSHQDVFILSESQEAEPTIVLCEGPIKALVLYERLRRLGVGYSVLTFAGVSFTDSIVHRVAEYYKRVHARRLIVCFDCDDAGISASSRVYKILSGAGIKVREVDYSAIRKVIGVTTEKGKSGIDDYLVKLELSGELGRDNVLPLKGVYIQPVKISEVECRNVQFLYEPLIPIGSMTVIEGDPGCGKSFLTIGMACSVASGRPLILGDNELTPQSTGPVLLFSCEDHSSVIKYRMTRICNGKVPDNIYLYQEPVDLSQFSDEVEEVVAGIMPKMLIIDPLMSYIGAGVDTYRDSVVRSVLMPYVNMAREYGFALVVVRHLSKNLNQKGVLRGIGSIAFSGLARAILLLEKDESGMLHLSAVKHSYVSITDFGMLYRIEEMSC